MASRARCLAVVVDMEELYTTLVCRANGLALSCRRWRDRGSGPWSLLYLNPDAAGVTARLPAKRLVRRLTWQ
jgi:hypothetical protein